MRNLYQQTLKTFFYSHLIQQRDSLGMTQVQMAQRLSMEERSYVSLEHGKSCCSGLTLARFLIYCCYDPAAYLSELRAAFEQHDSISV